MQTKVYAYIFFLFVFKLSFSQEKINIQGLILDAKNKKEVLPFTNVIIEDTSIGTISNEEGIFELTVSKKLLNSNVVISFVGYKNKLIPVSDFKKSRHKIYLEPASEALSEVVIKTKNKYQEYVGEAIKKIATNYSNQAVYLDTYYRELTQIDASYTKYTDADARLYYTSYQDTFDIDVARVSYMRFDKRDTQKQNTPFPEPIDHIGAPGDQAKINAIRKSNNLQKYQTDNAIDKISVLDVKDLEWIQYSEIGGGPLRLTGADKIKRKTDFFDPKKYTNYNFKLVGKSSYNNRPVYIIGFKPKDTTNCVAKYAGKLTMDQETKAIISYTYRPSQYCKKTSEQQFGTHLKTPDSIQKTKKIAFIRRTTTLKDFETKVSYSYYNYKWHLKNIKNTNYYRNAGDFLDSYSAVTHSELLVHNIDTKNVNSFSTPEVFETVFTNAIFNFPINYDPTFWENYNGIIPTGIVDKALEDLESKNSLEEQFKN